MPSETWMQQRYFWLKTTNGDFRDDKNLLLWQLQVALTFDNQNTVIVNLKFPFWCFWRSMQKFAEMQLPNKILCPEVFLFLFCQMCKKCQFFLNSRYLLLLASATSPSPVWNKQTNQTHFQFEFEFVAFPSLIAVLHEKYNGCDCIQQSMVGVGERVGLKQPSNRRNQPSMALGRLDGCR